MQFHLEHIYYNMHTESDINHYPFKGFAREVVVFGEPYSLFDSYTVHKFYSDKYSVSKPDGVVLLETWKCIGESDSISSLTSSPLYPKSPSVFYHSLLRTPFQNYSIPVPNSGSRIQFYYKPPVNGSYQFRLTVQDGRGTMNLESDGKSSTLITVNDSTGIYPNPDHEPEQSPLILQSNGEYLVTLLLRNLGSSVTLSLESNINSAGWYPVHPSQIGVYEEVSPMQRVDPDCPSFSFQGMPIGHSYELIFNVPFFYRVQDVTLAFLSPKYDSVNSMEIRVNDRLVKMKPLEFNKVGNMYKLIKIPLSKMVEGSNLLSFKMKESLPGLSFSDVHMYCLMSSRVSEVDLLDNVMMHLVTSSNTVLRWVVPEKLHKSFVGQSGTEVSANALAHQALTNQLKDFEDENLF